MRILYLEDDYDLAITTAEFLEEKGFDVVVAYDGQEALDISYDQNFDLFIFDVQVPYINGFELLKQLREANIGTPAIFTTSRQTIEDMSFGYGVGADDYIKKPFLLEELLLRVQALLKREYKSIDNLINIDEKTQFDVNKQQLIIDGQSVEINKKESLLLKLLCKNKNQCVDFDTIYESVWAFDDMHSEQSLRTYVKNLRKILGKEKIVSIKKQGYMLV